MFTRLKFPTACVCVPQLLLRGGKEEVKVKRKEVSKRRDGEGIRGRAFCIWKRCRGDLPPIQTDLVFLCLAAATASSW